MVSQLQTVSRPTGIPRFNVGVGPVGAHVKQAGMLLDASGAIFAVEAGDKVAFNGGIGFDTDGRMSITLTGEVASKGPGATPFDDAADLCVGVIAEPTNLIYMGVPLTDTGRVASGVASPANQLANSVWAGASGSVGGADWIPPTLWSNSFWPPDEAVALPNISGNGDTGIQFIVAANRGYIAIDVDTTLLIGETFNISIFIDDVTTSGAYANISGGNVTVIRAFPNVSNGFVGRVDAVYSITGITMGIRFGGGVTSNGTSDMTLSRPQITLGERLLPYEQTF